MRRIDYRLAKRPKALRERPPRRFIRASVCSIAVVMVCIISVAPANAQDEEVRPKQSPAFEKFRELAFQWKTINTEFQKAIKLCDLMSAERHYGELQEIFHQLRQMDEATKTAKRLGINESDFGLSYAVANAKSELNLRTTQLQKAKFDCVKKEKDEITIKADGTPATGGASGSGAVGGKGATPPQDKGTTGTGSAQNSPVDGTSKPRTAAEKEAADKSRGERINNRVDELLERLDETSIAYDKARQEGNAEREKALGDELIEINEEYRNLQRLRTGNVSLGTFSDALENETRGRSEPDNIDEQDFNILYARSETARSSVLRNREAAEEAANAPPVDEVQKADSDVLLDLLEEATGYSTRLFLLDKDVGVPELKDTLDDLIKEINSSLDQDGISDLEIDKIRSELNGVGESILRRENEASRQTKIDDTSAVPPTQPDWVDKDRASGVSCNSTLGAVNGASCRSFAVNFDMATLEIPTTGIGFRREGPLGTADEVFALESDSSIETFGGSVGLTIGKLVFGAGYVEGSSTRTATIAPNAGVDSGIVFSELRSGSSGVSGGQLGGVTSFTTDFDSFSVSGSLCIVGCYRKIAGPVPIPYPTDKTPENSKKVVVSGAKVMIKASANFTDTSHRGTFDTKFDLPGFSGSFGQTRDTRISEDRYSLSLDGNFDIGCTGKRICPYVGGYAGVHYNDASVRVVERNLTSFVPAPDNDFTLNFDDSDKRVGFHGGLRTGVKVDLGQKVGLNIGGGCNYISDVASVGFNFSGNQTLAGETLRIGRQSSFSCGASIGILGSF